jgi:tetratricopeptide (TPR) repeat protein
MAARQSDPDHSQMLRYLGHSLFKITKYKDAAAALRKALEMEPEDKESLFVLGQVYHNLGQNEQALRIFSHLRPDPGLGPNAALYAGTIHINASQFDKAVLDFEIGLRHQNIKQETALELRYRLAAAYAKKQDMGRALKLLQEIQKSAPGYRDVPALLAKYGELNSNRHLQTYLIAPTSDFVTLCRKLTSTFFPGAKVQITDISVNKNEYADILAEISTRKWEDVVLFRFVRTNGQVGELLLRDLYARLKEMRAGRGFCASAGEFTEGAKIFVEARLIDLVEKEGLMKKMKEIDR